MFRTTLCCTALAWACSSVSAKPRLRPAKATDAGSKPLNIMQFMREQAASTRVAKARPSYTQATAKAPRAPHRAIAARKKSVPVQVEAATAVASQPEQDTQQPAMGTPYNPFDRPADAAPAETTGAAVASGPEVQLVNAEDINDIDRKAEAPPALSSNLAHAPVNVGQTQSEQASVSWLQSDLVCVGKRFAALATAVHQLVGV